MKFAKIHIQKKTDIIQFILIVMYGSAENALWKLLNPLPFISLNVASEKTHPKCEMRCSEHCGNTVREVQ